MQTCMNIQKQWAVVFSAFDENSLLKHGENRLHFRICKFKDSNIILLQSSYLIVNPI
jgi:hypothetical protein